MGEETKIDETSLSEDDKMEIVNRRWKNRRRMAWVSIIMMVLMTFVLFFTIPEARLEKLQDVISWAYMAFASIVGAYMGLSTWAAKK